MVTVLAGPLSTTPRLLSLTKVYSVQFKLQIHTGNLSIAARLLSLTKVYSVQFKLHIRTYRQPFYSSQVTESPIGLQFTIQPVSTGHLSIAATFLVPRVTTIDRFHCS